MTNIKTHRGSCHCGTIQFEVDVDATQATMCNCRLCQKLGSRGAIVPPGALRVLSDESKHAVYPNAIGARYFCPTCSVFCYGRGNLPELGGDFASVNMNALDDIDVAELSLMYWDGRHDNWQAGLRPTPWPVFGPQAAREDRSP